MTAQGACYNEKRREGKDEELIPRIYNLAKTKGIKMTTFVNEILTESVNKIESKNNELMIKEEGSFM